MGSIGAATYMQSEIATPRSAYADTNITGAGGTLAQDGVSGYG